MSEREKAELKELLGEVFEERVEPKLSAFEEKLSGALRRRNLALFTAIACLVAAAFSAGYALNSRTQLHDQIRTNALVVCSSARSTALAFREPQISADGTKEKREHFLERMLAQRETLIAAGRIECPSLPGFESFPYQRARALYEIDRILHDLNPRRFPPAHHHPIPRASSEPDPVSSIGSNPTAAGPTSPVAASPPSGPSAAGGGGGGNEKSGGGAEPTNPHQSNPPPSHGGHEAGGGGNEGGSTGGSEGSPGGAGGAGGAGGEGGSGGGGGGEEGGGSSSGVVGGTTEAAGEVLCTVNKLTGLEVCTAR